MTFGADTRVVAQFANEQLSIYYALQIVNSAQTPVDIGGPLTIELPREARVRVDSRGVVARRRPPTART